MILVTGAAGRLGKLVVLRLLEKGYNVLGSDQVPLENSPTEFVQGDLCDAGFVNDLLKGAEAVIHMGAIPGPTRAEPRFTFENNVQSTFNVFMTAEDYGIRRVVFSSSAFGMGWAHDPTDFVPIYLPLDEDHPMMPFEPYGMSKQVGEDIGAMVARRSSTSVVSLRFTNVAWPEVQVEFPWPAPTPEDALTLVMWAYADPNAVVEAQVQSLEADITGHEAFLIVEPQSRFAEPTADVIRANFGSAVEIRSDRDDNWSPISTDKARRVLSWRPKAEWAV